MTIDIEMNEGSPEKTFQEAYKVVEKLKNELKVLYWCDESVGTSYWIPTTFRNTKIEKVFEQSLKKDQDTKKIFDNALPAVLKFVPYNRNSVIIRESQLPIVNTWINPDIKWLDKNSVNEIPKIYEHLFLNMFPNQNEREIVLQWIIQGQRGKLQKFLMLVSRGGSGKGTIEEFLVDLLLKENTKKIDNSEFLKDARFNAGYDKATLLVLDELLIDSAAGKAKLKKLINNSDSITAKGIDSKDSEIYCNLLICTNLKDGVSIEDTQEDRRRFFVPKITETPMKDYCRTYNENYNVQEYRKEILDPKNIKQFYNWCLNQRETIDFTEDMVTPTHLELINSSAPLWAQEAKDFIDRILERTKIVLEVDVKEHILENNKDIRKISSKTLVETMCKFYGSEIAYVDRGSSFKENRRVFTKKGDNLCKFQ